MQYMLLIYFEEQALTQADRDQCYADSAQYARALDANGKFIHAAPLYPVDTATSLRVRDGRRMLTDGPFAETREQLGGFFLVEAKDLDEAIDIAAQIPAGKWGTVEVRPVIPVQGVPKKSMQQAVDSAASRSTQ